MRELRSAALVAALIATVLACGCASAPRAVDAGPRATIDEFVAGLNAGDIVRVEATLAADVTAFVPSAAAARVESKEALLEILRAFLDAAPADAPRPEIVPENLRVTVRGDMALVTFQVRGEGRMARRSFVLERRGARWSIVHFHASNASTEGS